MGIHGAFNKANTGALPEQMHPDESQIPHASIRQWPESPTSPSLLTASALSIENEPRGKDRKLAESSLPVLLCLWFDYGWTESLLLCREPDASVSRSSGGLGKNDCTFLY